MENSNQKKEKCKAGKISYKGYIGIWAERECNRLLPQYSRNKKDWTKYGNGRLYGEMGNVLETYEDYNYVGEVLDNRLDRVKEGMIFKGNSIEELKQDFKSVVEKCLVLEDIEDKYVKDRFMGGFNVRIPSDMHCALSKLAADSNTSINNLVVRAIGDFLDKQEEVICEDIEVEPNDNDN